MNDHECTNKYTRMENARMDHTTEQTDQSRTASASHGSHTIDSRRVAGTLELWSERQHDNGFPHDAVSALDKSLRRHPLYCNVLCERAVCLVRLPRRAVTCAFVRQLDAIDPPK